MNEKKLIRAGTCFKILTLPLSFIIIEYNEYSSYDDQEVYDVSFINRETRSSDVGRVTFVENKKMIKFYLDKNYYEIMYEDFMHDHSKVTGVPAKLRQKTLKEKIIRVPRKKGPKPHQPISMRPFKKYGLDESNN